jgi:acetyltransferase-like isoleucine patch superfamily enzyme
MNLARKIISKARLFYLSKRFEGYSFSGYLDFSLKLTRPENIKIGHRCIINEDVWIASLEGPGGYGSVTINDEVTISKGTIIASAFSVIIGKGATIAPRVSIYDNNHEFENLTESVMNQGLKGASVSIGDYAWLGVNAIILPGISIGKGAIVGAGSVVTKSVDDFQIVAGNPAKLIGYRKK